MLQASARPHPRISHTTDYRQHHTRIIKFSKHHPNEPRSVIGELAAETGTTTRALRFYEEQGLLESDRKPSGYRVYSPHAVTRVRNVRDLLASGFTVENVQSFVRYLDTDLPEVFEYSPLWAAG
ncbi:MerR family transcriptional regulator [Streptomyces herbicida]|uniref:MerR family transcriptional regulator n=1 Tax=Streptomyces herbicida TaxID=3065675 RepID=UPI00292D53FE|nr:MerR family transcriptional regulator [Streptomyces sp. NEAU-HV9]